MRIELGSPITVKEILSSTEGYSETELPDCEIKFLTTDSREMCEGDLFIPLRGEATDGESFVEAAKAAGGLCLSRYSSSGAITVKNTSLALLLLARHYKRTKLKSLRSAVGITGSVGKTTTKEMLFSLLKNKFLCHKSAGNLNNHIGLPLTVLSSPVDAEVLICEMGMNHSGEIEALSLCLEPTLAIITNVGTAHIGNLGSRENIARAKLEILRGMKNPRFIYGGKEPLLEKAGAISAGIDSEELDFKLLLRSRERGKTRFDISYGGVLTEGLEVSLSACHSLKCLSLALCASIEIGIDEGSLKKSLASLSEENERWREIKLKGLTVFDDSYNASFESIEADLAYLKEQGLSFSVLLGDLYELGNMTAEIHKKLGRLAFSYGANKIYAVGKYAKYVGEGAASSGMNASRIFVNGNRENPEATLLQIISTHAKGETLLVKGSHGMRLWEFTEMLKERIEE